MALARLARGLYQPTETFKVFGGLPGILIKGWVVKGRMVETLGGSNEDMGKSGQSV